MAANSIAVTCIPDSFTSFLSPGTGFFVGVNANPYASGFKGEGPVAGRGGSWFGVRGAAQTGVPWMIHQKYTRSRVQTGVGLAGDRRLNPDRGRRRNRGLRSGRDRAKTGSIGGHTDRLRGWLFFSLGNRSRCVNYGRSAPFVARVCMTIIAGGIWGHRSGAAGDEVVLNELRGRGRIGMGEGAVQGETVDCGFSDCLSPGISRIAA